MKKLLVLATLLAALASFGCGSDEPAADAPAKAAKVENKIPDKQKQSNDAYNKSLEKIKSKYKDGEPKIEAKPGDTIHHFSK